MVIQMNRIAVKVILTMFRLEDRDSLKKRKCESKKTYKAENQMLYYSSDGV